MLTGILWAAAHDEAASPGAAGDCAATLLAGGSGVPARLVASVASSMLCHQVSGVTDRGWQPRDLAEITRRRLAGDHSALLVDLLASSAAAAPAATTHPRWVEQLRDLGAQVWWRPDTPLVAARSQRDGRSPLAWLATSVELLALLLRLPDLPRLLPPPGKARQGAGGRPVDANHGRALARVRSLLAKAESTDFAEEAEALSAKAQELMAKHNLERLMVESAADEQAPASARRLWLEAPYAGAKAMLVQAVAHANGCATVWVESLGFVTVVGDERDLDTCELLLTSLLVQATKAMVAAGREPAAPGRPRTRSYRQSFLMSYATRIGERLRGATDSAAAGLDEVDLLPVLVAQRERVESARDAMFPERVQRAVSISNRHGWSAGRAAADIATLPNPVELGDRTRAAS